MHFTNVLPLLPAFLHLDVFVASTITGKWTEPYFFMALWGYGFRDLLSELVISLSWLAPGCAWEINFLANSSLNSVYWRMSFLCFPKTWLSGVYCIQLFVADRLSGMAWHPIETDHVITHVHSSHVIVLRYNCRFGNTDVTLFFIGPPHTAALWFYSVGCRSHENWFVVLPLCHCKFQRFSNDHFGSSLSLLLQPMITWHFCLAFCWDPVFHHSSRCR